jgi:hypothetical protein
VPVVGEKLTSVAGTGESLFSVQRVAMSNPCSFKIESFCFGAFVPKKIEYIRHLAMLFPLSLAFNIGGRNPPKLLSQKCAKVL